MHLKITKLIDFGLFGSHFKYEKVNRIKKIVNNGNVMDIIQFILMHFLEYHGFLTTFVP